MGETLMRFRADCRSWYARPRNHHCTEARVQAYKALLQRHSAIALTRHVPTIAAVLTRAELEYAQGDAAAILRANL